MIKRSSTRFKGRNAGLKRSNRRSAGSVIPVYSAKGAWQTGRADKSDCATRKLSPEELAALLENPYAPLSGVAALDANLLEPGSSSRPTLQQLPKLVERSIHSNPKAPRLPGPPRDPREFRFCAELAKALGGKTEQWNQAGRVDVLTRHHVIEVKVAENWKHAIGQVLVYSSYYPGLHPVIFLIGANAEAFANLARPHCNRYGICLATQAQELQ